MRRAVHPHVALQQGLLVCLSNAHHACFRKGSGTATERSRLQLVLSRVDSPGTRRICTRPGTEALGCAQIGSRTPVLGEASATPARLEALHSLYIVSTIAGLEYG